MDEQKETLHKITRLEGVVSDAEENIAWLTEREDTLRLKVNEMHDSLQRLEGREEELRKAMRTRGYHFAVEE